MRLGDFVDSVERVVNGKRQQITNWVDHDIAAKQPSASSASPGSTLGGTMSLANERITLNPLEESADERSVGAQRAGAAWGSITAAQGSLWTPAATETPQLAQSVDTEGALNIATQIGTRTSPIIKFGVVEPLDPAGTNWALNPQCVSTGSAFTQVKGSGAAT